VKVCCVKITRSAFFATMGAPIALSAQMSGCGACPGAMLK
jgi:hypothetical protein